MSSKIENALSVLKKGGTILYPTDTIWGIGCDATNQNAANKIHNIKQRDPDKSYICLFSDYEMLEAYFDGVPRQVIEFLESSKVPTTMILPNAKTVAKNVMAKDNTLAIRIPNNPFCHTLISKFNKPLVATSANISGEDYPKNLDEVSQKVKTQVDYILDLPDFLNEENVPSVIIKYKPEGQFIKVRG